MFNMFKLMFIINNAYVYIYTYTYTQYIYTHTPLYTSSWWWLGGGFECGFQVPIGSGLQGPSLFFMARNCCSPFTWQPRSPGNHVEKRVEREMVNLGCWHSCLPWWSGCFSLALSLAELFEKAMEIEMLVNASVTKTWGLVKIEEPKTQGVIDFGLFINCWHTR